MKFVVLLIVTLIVLINCNKAVSTPKESKEKINDILSVILDTDTIMGVNNYTECGQNMNNLRWYFRFLPEEVKQEIKSQLVSNIIGQFPRLRYEVVVRLVNQMFDLNVDSQFVCRYFLSFNCRELDRILFPEARRRDICSRRCSAKIDLSPLRMVNISIKK